MAQIRHIAIQTQDEEATARFYIENFGLKQVRKLDSARTSGYFLTDGHINLAILRFGWDQGPGLDFRGIHHFGVLVEDVDAHTEKLEKLGATCFARRPPGTTTFYETKFHGPDRVVFDITDHPWKGAAPLPSAEEAAKEKAPLLQPVKA